MSSDGNERAGGRLEAGEVADDPAAAVRTRRFRWLPDQRLTPWLPRGFALDMAVVERGGARRLAPAEGGWDEFLPQAWAAGLALSAARGNLEPQDVQRHRLAWFLVLKARSIRPYLRRGFEGPLDLKVSRTGRRSDDERTVIPTHPDGRSLSVAELFDLGRELARERGEVSPSVGRLVHLGLLGLALRAPLELKPSAAARVVRRAVFDEDAAPSDLAGDLVTEVWDRFCDAFAGHLDDAADEFDAWLTGRKSGLINQLAKRKTAAGVLDRERVTAALAQIGFRGFACVAECVEAAVLEVAARLPEPLSADDGQCLRAVYGRRPYLGGLSWPVLRQRCSFLREAILAVWGDESAANVGVLHRLLCYYAEMATERRDADRRRKRALASPEDDAERRVASTAMTGNDAREVAALLNAECLCPVPEWRVWARRSNPSELECSCECARCGRHVEGLVQVPRGRRRRKA